MPERGKQADELRPQALLRELPVSDGYSPVPPPEAFIDVSVFEREDEQ